MIKFSLPSKDGNNKKALIAASKGYYKNSNGTGNSYTSSYTSQTPLTKNAQFAGAGANVIWTQPMFFSPLHTPQNWQVASKRREVYQWSFIDNVENPCFISKYDGSLISIASFFEECIDKRDKSNNECIYTDPTSSYIRSLDIGPTSSCIRSLDPNNTPIVQDGHGNPSLPDKASKHYTKKKANKIKALGVAEPLSLTHDHNCIVIKKEDIQCRKSKWNKKKCVYNYIAPTCKKHNCSECIDKEYKISKIKARDIEKGDSFLVPFNTDIEHSIIDSEDKARYAGHLASDGWVCSQDSKSKRKGTSICMNTGEVEYVKPCIDSVYNSFGVKSPRLETTKHSSELLTCRTSMPSVYNFSSRLVIGKSSEKKFTSQVTLLDPKLQLHVLGAYIQSDGSYNKANNCVEITTYSKHLCNQLLMMFYRCGILARANKQPISKSKKTFKTKNEHRYIVNVSSSECYKIKEYVPGKLSNSVPRSKGSNKRFFWKNFVVTPVVSNESFDYEGYVYDVRVPGTFTVTANEVATHQSRFYYENEAKVAAGVDFYCFTPDSQVLMADGEQKSISSIREGDLVRCHDGSCNQVEKVHKKKTDEDMFSIKIAGVNNGALKATAGHEILVDRDGNKEWIQVWELRKEDYLLTPANYEANFSDNQEFSISKDFAWLIGIYAAEGCGIPYEHISKKGKKRQYYKGVYFTININEVDLAIKIQNVVNKLYPVIQSTIRKDTETSTMIIAAYGRSIADDLIGLCPGNATDGDKRLTSVIMRCNNDILKHLLSGFLDGDGCFNKNNGFQGVGVAKKLCEQLSNICDRLGLAYSFHNIRFSEENRQTCYNFRISRRSCDIFENINLKYYNTTCIDKSKIRNIPYIASESFIKRKVLNIKTKKYKGDVYDLTVKDTHTYVVNRVAVHNSQFPMNGFKLECKDKKVLKYFEKTTKRLRINHWLKMISHEYFLLGDVFPFLEIHCKICGGSGKLPNGDDCNHAGGDIGRIVVLNPDWIEVQTNVLANEPIIALVPDDELRMIVARRQPKQIYDKLPKKLIELVSTGAPIPLSNRSVSHMKHNASPYGTYGTSLLRRLFTTLAYKTKLMTANWIVAERMILPLRVVKIGDKERPASPDDLSDVANQLAAVANDPNLTLVTHHAFDYSWIGASGKIHNITNELEYIGKEILDGFMLNQAILNGEMACHDEETMTLTDSGFKKYDKISENDKIACYNPETKRLEYHSYINKHVYDYDGEMIKFQTDKIDILVTPNHRMWIQSDSSGFKFIEAKDVKSKSQVLGITIDSSLEHENYSICKIDNEISKQDYNGKVYCFEVPYGLFVTKRNDKITIQGNSYSSAQVGIEVMIRRLESWRSSLAEWVENHIFLPIAMMQGFIDKEESKEMGENMYIYPTLKWEDLQLRDTSNLKQMLIQLHDKQLVSTQTLLQEFDLDYDTEIQKLREEQVLVGAQGQMMGGAGAGGGMMGGMGGAPMGGDIGGMGGMPGMPGGEMGGMPGMPGGEMGGMPGGEMGGMPGGMGGAPIAASEPGLKVTKRGKQHKAEQAVAPQPTFLKLTSLEQKMYNLLIGMEIPARAFAQYKVAVAGQQQPYVMDFAFPSIGVCVEVDGKKWHEEADAKARDMGRDNKLAGIGWRILRFKEKAINNNMDQIQKVIAQNVKEAVKEHSQRKKTASDDEVEKIASKIFEGIDAENVVYQREELDNDLGYMYIIGV